MDMIREIVNKIKEIPEDQLDAVIDTMIEINKIDSTGKIKFKDSILSIYYCE